MTALRQRPRAPKALDETTPLPSPAWSPEDTKRRGHASVPKAALLVVAFLLFYTAVLATIAHFHTWLPAPQPIDAPQNEFSEARARVVLEKIMSFGYRPVGTKANDELTPAYLLSEIEKIKAAAPKGVSIEIDVQKPTGAFGIDFLAQFQNIYANVTNIVVRVASTSSPNEVDVLEDSLMISSHYDAAIGGAAASDDGVNIAIMMETLRYFSHQPPTYGSLIFNFNGAEETIMQAAHGFITQHKWTKNIRAFINMEAAGAGGRELLFQTSSDELALAYAEGAKYPHASIIAQELFQTGVIPADTDFRVYRDFGAVAGMDFAYIANGYVYHTKLDDVSRIQQGAIQRLGENIVGVVERLTNEPGRLTKIAATPHSSNTLFFDVAGLFMISMGRTMAFSLCFGVVLLAVLYLVSSPITWSERSAAFKLMWRCIGAGLCASLFTGVVLTLFAPMSWYTMPYLGAAAFISPALAGMLDRLATFLDKTTRQNSTSDALWRVEESLFEAMLSTWLVCLIGMLSVNAISSYIMAVWVFFPLAGQVVCHALQRLKVLPPSLYVVVSLGAVAIPVIHSGFVLVLAFMFFIPLMGRCGGQPPPDLLIAIVFGLSLMIMLSYSSRFFCFVSTPTLRLLRNLLVAITIGVVLISTTVNPYSDITPKRVMLQHLHREVVLPNGTVTTQDSGLWINTMDFRGVAPLKPFLATTQWKNASLLVPPTTLLDTFDIYGDVPYGLPVRDFIPERFTWYLPAAPPVFTESEPQPTLDVLSSTFDAETNRRTVHVRFTGPAHLDLFIDATKTTLTSWSIGEGVSGPAAHSDGTYILHFATGAPPAAFEFWLEAEGNKPIDVGVVGHHLEKRTPEMQAFVKALPPWCDTLEFVSTWSTQTI